MSTQSVTLTNLICLPQLPTYGEKITYSGLEDEVRALVMAAAINRQAGPVLILCASEKRAKSLRDLLEPLTQRPVELFLPMEAIAFEVLAQSREVANARVRILSQVSQKGYDGIIIATPDALKARLMPCADWMAHSTALAVNADIDLKALMASLVEKGYRHQPVVEQTGEFSLRGGILDVFSPLYEEPIRIEFFDTEIDSMRFFDPRDQRSVKSVEEVVLTPAREVFVDSNLAARWTERIKEAEKDLVQQFNSKTEKQAAQNLRARLAPVYAALKSANADEELDLFRGYFFDKITTLLDYYQERPFVIFDELNRIEDDILASDEERHLQFTDLLTQGIVLPGQWDSYLTAEDFKPLFANQAVLAFQVLKRVPKIWTDIHYSLYRTESLPHYFNQLNLLESELLRWRDLGMRILALYDDQAIREKFRIFLQDHDLPFVDTLDLAERPGLYLQPSPLAVGGIFWEERLVVLPLRQALTGSKKQRRRRRSQDEADRYDSAEELSVGDYVVHDQHGIGQFLGMKHQKIGDVEKDYLIVKYAGTDKLYIPVSQFDLLQRYIGHEGQKPKLNRLSTGDWQRTKKRVTQSVQDMADRLIRLYAKREQEPGHAFPPDSDLQRDFEADFPYVETDDQLKAIADVKADMMRTRPMDRLICGDVGYGKTEVAVRAAFKAFCDAKQVAVLVPTTVLAQQHYQTFSERFTPYGAKVAVLSRFNTAKETAEILADLRDHKIDVVIGTHKLLGKSVKFNDLGLLVVDEEQRFGVTHKERIKALKTDVDVLTLSATPIPRTLQLSLVGLRDMSVIETPPADRYPIQTYIVEFNDAILTQAIRRELDRGGQIYIIHNRVSELNELAAHIQTLVPEARLAIAHGRSTDRRLEETMMAFVNQEYDILICTTIVETGLDIPNVNTLIVHHADRFGLSQLYQLRGRVGRSKRIAYAYLTYERNKMLTDIAEKRLNTLKEYTALGSGYRIAMKDLELRGAGNILGAEQHGHVADVGFALYMQLLDEAIRKQSGQVVKEKHTVELDVHMNAFLSKTYIPDDAVRLGMYKRLEQAESEEELAALADELQDRFGLFDEPLVNLLALVSLKLLAMELGIRSIKQRHNQLELMFYPDTPISMPALMAYVQSYKNITIGNQSGELAVKLTLLKERLTATYVDSIKERLKGMQKIAVVD